MKQSPLLEGEGSPTKTLLACLMLVLTACATNKPALYASRDTHCPPLPGSPGTPRRPVCRWSVASSTSCAPNCRPPLEPGWDAADLQSSRKIIAFDDFLSPQPRRTLSCIPQLGPHSTAWVRCYLTPVQSFF